MTFALALAAGVVAQLIAGHLRAPSIVPLLAAGIILGPDGLGLIHPRSLGEGLFSLVSLAVAVILFEGGLNLDLRRLGREGSAIRRLVTVGALVTAAGGALAAGSIMGWSPRLSILFGTLVIVTGPTVIRPLLRNVPLRPRLATVLEAEGVLIDPIGAIVAVVTLEVVLTPGIDSFTSGFPVVYGNVLEMRTLARMRLERARAVIGLTANNEVNSHFVGEARDEFGVRDGYVAVNLGSGEVTSRIVAKQESRILFDGPKDVERWHVRFRHGDVAVRTFCHLEPRDAVEAGEKAPAPEESRATAADGAGLFIVLAVKRGERWEPMFRDLEIEAGETSAVAIYQPAEEAAEEALARIGWVAGRARFPVVPGSGPGGGEFPAGTARSR